MVRASEKLQRRHFMKADMIFEPYDTCICVAAFHVGRAELLQWINGLLDLRYGKVEQCANGAAYCMILNSTFQVHLPTSHLFVAPKQQQLPMKTTKWGVAPDLFGLNKLKY